MFINWAIVCLLVKGSDTTYLLCDISNLVSLLLRWHLCLHAIKSLEEQWVSVDLVSLWYTIVTFIAWDENI